MSDWQRQLGDATTTADQLVQRFGEENIDPAAVEKAAADFNLRITPEIMALIKSPGDPLWLQYGLRRKKPWLPTESWIPSPKIPIPLCQTLPTAILTGCFSW